MTDKFKPGYNWRSLIKSENKSQTFSRSQIHDSNVNHYLPNYFDELVIDNWFHLEMMDENSYWIRVGEYRIGIKFIDGSDKPEVYVEKE